MSTITEVGETDGWSWIGGSNSAGMVDTDGTENGETDGMETGETEGTEISGADEMEITEPDGTRISMKVSAWSKWRFFFICIN